MIDCYASARVFLVVDVGGLRVAFGSSQEWHRWRRRVSPLSILPGSDGGDAWHLHQHHSWLGGAKSQPWLAKVQKSSCQGITRGLVFITMSYARAQVFLVLFGFLLWLSIYCLCHYRVGVFKSFSLIWCFNLSFDDWLLILMYWDWILIVIDWLWLIYDHSDFNQI